MVLVQKWPFFQLSFLGNIAEENIFYDVLKGKYIFPDYKNKKFKKSKNWHFSKEVNPWFWSKNGHFSTFFFKEYRRGKCLLRCSKKKYAFPDYKIKKFKKSKNWYGFGPKMAIFWSFFFRHYRPGKCILRYSRRKKRLSRL